MPRTIISDIVVAKYEKQSSFSFCQYTSIRFFEIVYFKEGTGRMKINGVETKYGPDQFFVFIPDDVYIVEVDTPTSTITVKFLKSIFLGTKEFQSKIPGADWFRKIELVLNYESHQGRELSFHVDTDKNDLIMLIEFLHREYERKYTGDLSILEYSLSILLRIISRNIAQMNPHDVSTPRDSRIQDIIDYIHTNVLNPDCMTNTHLAEHFHMADRYIGQYFKRHMNVSLKSYILDYKLKLVERRLKYTDMRNLEIALELGFTDSSHLNKIFLSHRGISIADYKTQNFNKSVIPVIK